MTQIVRHFPLSHCLGVASTQSGKTTCLVVPTILDPGTDRTSLIIHDPKDEGDPIPGGELYTLTAGWRSQVSKVIRFQPSLRRRIGMTRCGRSGCTSRRKSAICNWSPTC